MGKFMWRDILYSYSIEHFYNEGFENVSMNRILSGTKCTAGTFYHNFRSKADLLSIYLSGVYDKMCEFNLLDAKDEYKDFSRSAVVIIYLSLIDKKFANLAYSLFNDYVGKKYFFKRISGRYTSDNYVTTDTYWMYAFSVSGYIWGFLQSVLYDREKFDTKLTSNEMIKTYISEKIFEYFVTEHINRDEIAKTIAMLDNLEVDYFVKP